MPSYGYARVSSKDQSFDLQRATLVAAGCSAVRGEVVSGTSTTGRDELRVVLDFISKGDELFVTRIERLGRSIGDLQNILLELRAKGATLRATEQPIDTSTAAGKLFSDMLGAFAEFETCIRKERQAEGIAAAKKRVVYRGRKPSVDRDKVLRLSNDGRKPGQIARELGCSRSTVWRILNIEG